MWQYDQNIKGFNLKVNFLPVQCSMMTICKRIQLGGKNAYKCILATKSHYIAVFNAFFVACSLFVKSLLILHHYG